MSEANQSSNIEVLLVRHPVRAAEAKPFPREAGAECIFLGRTRSESHSTHGELLKLQYEAYEPMALSMLQSIAQQALKEFGCLFVRVHHAMGDVPVGEASVLVQVITPHRDRAFAACRFVIDQLKQNAPIWKREVWTIGQSWPSGSVVNPMENAT